MSGKIVVSGVAALVAGVAMLGLSFASPQRAWAGNTQIPCDATATATPDQEGPAAITSLQQLTDTPIPTCTPVKLKTHTPTNTPTEAPTQTPVPVTPAPSSTAVPATATQPGGGAGGQQVLPPNTGTGATAGGGPDMMLLVAGLALSIVGGGSVALGAVRRR